MTLSEAWLIGLWLHLIGDYVTQNDWMAQNKTKSDRVAMIHAIIYSAPFLFLVTVWPFNLILFSHFFIDRYRLAQYYIKLVNWNWESKNFGFDDNKPAWMSVWLMIIIDNIFHITINSIAIWLSF